MGLNESDRGRERVGKRLGGVLGLAYGILKAIAYLHHSVIRHPSPPDFQELWAVSQLPVICQNGLEWSGLLRLLDCSCLYSHSFSRNPEHVRFHNFGGHEGNFH